MTFGHQFDFAAIFGTWPEWPLAVGLLAATWFAVWLLRPVATFLHEMGHVLPALLFTREIVELRVGELNQKGETIEQTEPLKEDAIAWRRLGRLRWTCSFRGSFLGFTGYNRQALGKFELLAVIAGGPVVSFLACGLGAWLTLDVLEVPWQQVAGGAFLCANAILFLRSAVPVTLKCGEPSDGLDFWRTLRKAK